MIASIGSFFGWSETAADGRFELEERGAFLTVRHEEFKPALIEVDRNQQEVLVLLQPVDDSI